MIVQLAKAAAYLALAVTLACFAVAAAVVTWRFLTWLDFAGLGT